jgi:ABC-type uncharacterized transport system permease subunit
MSYKREALSNLAIVAVTLTVLALLFCIVEYSVPAVQEYLFIQDCKSVEWITDTCTESHHFWRYN